MRPRRFISPQELGRSYCQGATQLTRRTRHIPQRSATAFDLRIALAASRRKWAEFNVTAGTDVRTKSSLECEQCLAYGALVLDAGAYSLTYEGCDIPVTYAEFLLLSEMMHHPTQVITLDRLVRVLGEVQTRAAVDASAGSIRTRIARLRAKLDLAGLSCIKTMRRVGYGFVPPSTSSVSTS
jgi:DNA-binding response OmpR family regulator